jgi:hypothetical protein
LGGTDNLGVTFFSCLLLYDFAGIGGGFDVFDLSGLWGTSGGNFDEESIFVLDGSTGGFDELFVLVTGFKMADVLLLLELLELVLATLCLVAPDSVVECSNIAFKALAIPLAGLSSSAFELSG